MTTSTLHVDDVKYVLNRLPKDVLHLMENHHIFLAGGFIRSVIAGEKPNDIDLFGAVKLYLEEHAATLVRGRGNCRSVLSKNATTVLAHPYMPVQFIHRWLYANPLVLLDEFDFTIARAVIWRNSSKEWQSACDPDFYRDLAARRLVYRAPDRREDAGGSIMRVVKFLRRGYTIQTPSLARVITRLVEGVDMDALPGAPGALEATLQALLIEVDPSITLNGRFEEPAHEVLDTIVDGYGETTT